MQTQFSICLYYVYQRPIFQGKLYYLHPYQEAGQITPLIMGIPQSYKTNGMDSGKSDELEPSLQSSIST